MNVSFQLLFVTEATYLWYCLGQASRKLKALFELTIKRNALETLLTSENFCLFNMIKITCHSSSDYQKINCYAGTVHLYSLEEIFCMFAGTCQLGHNTSVFATWMDVRNFWVCGCVVTHLALHIKVFFFPAFYCRVFGCKNGCVMNMWPCFWESCFVR